MSGPIVVKLGGALLGDREALGAACDGVAALAAAHAVVVVPGGGPFADVVRDVQREHAVTDDAAHWMAILGMDQYAWLLAERIAGGRLVEGPEAVAVALAERRVPVLAPARWLRRADPLPHRWEASGDSLAAWIAAQLGARELRLVKRREGTLEELADAGTAEIAGPGVTVRCVTPTSLASA